MRNPIADPTAPHQIVLTTTPRRAKCLDGQATVPMGLAVTCNCHRAGLKNTYTAFMAPLPQDDAVPVAWQVWNDPAMHKGDDFEPNQEMLARHGTREFLPR